ncbi:MAG TPA: 3'(2'),5'-bisphosphate nucleotidase CysQ [Steroidobacteraceae bacterium]|nr:3'(2'),5'-bisphosphate nucleotidase CysQ [Steroidobacteraceae bacterium]HUL19570.1 3'(2'),5'-bisphosphate nucleotidase CysQ [Steroidobacteraceae bacterium]
MSDSQLLEAMIGAAIEAGRVVDHIYRTGFEVHAKADSSPVTTADSAAERMILEHLKRAAPAVPVVAEEQSAAGNTPALAREFFLVDPLDGTKEFIARRGEFTINIALIREHVPVLGVVYAPANRCLFAADAAAGRAFRSAQDPGAPHLSARESICVRAVPASGITAVASRSHRTPETDAYLRRYEVADLVSIGSSLKFCLVAEGKADLYPRLAPTMEWDTAAGHAVLLGAGGRVCAPDGRPLKYGKPGFRNPWFVASGPLEPLPLAA